MEINRIVTGKTRLIGLIGNPVEHSISPFLHNTISRHFHVDAVYVPFRVEKDFLESAVKGLKALNVLGFNVTVPYKKDIMKYIDESTKEAVLMRAVNTVKNVGGRLYGYNTDAEGFSKSFKEETGTGFEGKKVFIIGAGGAARAIAVKTAIEGAEKIYISNRTLSKAVDIAEIINNNIGNRAEALGGYDREICEAFNCCDIIINTTSVGMYPNIDESPLGKSCVFSGRQVAYDAIYNPPKTKFLSEAEKKGCKTVNGLGMLFYQGIFAYEIWTGLKLQEDFLKELYQAFKGIFA